ncbi:A/G-specific adenine glycosylase [Geothrix campi]|uniref:A/G-specific adenine glycosylase n=1 Tax=Geothrix campi TaxID=2966450 RepID=UPI0021492784|nr:A/G-specific adenine glycosylase [Geothrix sp. SG10]
MPWPPASTLLAPLSPWFEAVRRDLPWRAGDLDAAHPDPYAVLVSELMLQQTQVATVIPYFTRWMERFPNPGALAEADEDTLHKAWEGLGYYRRARFLKAAVDSIAAEGWPGDLEGLARLPGLGPYTAAAVGAIAFQWPAPALDGNAFRVLARLLVIEGDPKARAADLRAWLAPALEAHGPSRLTQALMELGATVCTPTPACSRCPLADRCGAHVTNRTAEIPPVAKRAKPKASCLWLLAMEAEGHVLLHAPADKGLLAGLWRWPALDVETLPPARFSLQGTHPITFWPGWTQVYTHRREHVSPLYLRLEARFETAKGLRWIPRAELPNLPLGKRDQRLRDLLATPGQTPLVAPDPATLIRACAAPSA